MPNRPTMPVADPYIVNVELDPAYAASGLRGSAELAGDADYFASVIRYVLVAEGAHPPLEVGLRVVADAEIQALHYQFFGLDTPTDVIAFGQQEQDLAATAQPFATDRVEPAGLRYWEHEDIQLSYHGTQHSALSTQHFVAPPSERSYLGDIVASFETAAVQAVDYGHTALEELTELVMHGTLHLLGYDDHDPTSYHLMHSHEDAYMAAFLATVRNGHADA